MLGIVLVEYNKYNHQSYFRIDLQMFPDRMPIVIIACRVFQSLFGTLLPAHLRQQVTYLEYGLHDFPKKLAKTIQEQIDQVEQPSLIVLGYGLCGNGLNNIQARQHTLLIPRADDCIAILLGSYQAYRDEFDSTPGTYYLSKGWLEAGSNPLDEFIKYVEKYGEEKALWLMDEQYHAYKRLVYVAQDAAEWEKYRQKIEDIAHFCERWGMKLEVKLGSGEYVVRLAEIIQNLTLASDDFLVIPPGGEIQQLYFIARE